jgi:hypothetical protein
MLASTTFWNGRRGSAKYAAASHFRLRRFHGDPVHALAGRILAGAALEVDHLLDHVRHRQAGQVRRFRMAEPGHQVARAARHRAAASLDDDLGRCRMLVRKPVRRIEEIVNLFLSVGS